MALAGRRLASQTCYRIKALLDNKQNLSAADIGLQVGVSKRTIERMRLSYELFDQPYPPSFNKTGRPRALTTEEARVGVCFAVVASII